MKGTRRAMTYLLLLTVIKYYYVTNYGLEVIKLYDEYLKSYNIMQSSL